MTTAPARVAALTMVYNEPFFLPIWLRHYARQVGPENCYVIDHGSDDGSTTGLPAHVLQRPRTVRDEGERVRWVTEAVTELLHRYQAVVHADVDELFLADPALHADLRGFAATAPEVSTGFGLDLHHLPGEEPPLDTGRPLGAQRRWVRFAASMCKPGLVRRPVAWSPGFHSSDAPLRLGSLFLLHLRYLDLDEGLRRLAATRALPVALPAAHVHQRVPDNEFRALMAGVAGLPRREPAPFHVDAPPLRNWADRLRRSRAEREDQPFKLDLGLQGNELWALPPSFRAALP